MTNKNHKKDDAIKHNTPDFTRKNGVQLLILQKNTEYDFYKTLNITSL